MLSNEELKDETMEAIDITGQTFGQWTVIGRAPNIISGSGKRRRSRVAFYCRCICGAEKIILGESLRRGLSKSCGCAKAYYMSTNLRTHGGTETPLYGVWCAMKARCNNPNATAYGDYGGRGIRVCDEWLHDFSAFRDWAVSAGYVDTGNGHQCSIDRIDVNGNYCPENCRWVDSVAQANNRRSNHYLTFNGETHNLTEWAQITGLPMKKIADRIYHGWDTERALTTA